MDELELLARQAEAEEQATAASEALGEAEATGKPAQSEPQAEPGAAENLAETVLRLGEGAARLLVDNRLALSDDDIDGGRAALGPAIDKHDLASGTGRMPYQEEITAGLWLGGLIRRARATLRRLKAEDKAKRERLKRNGEERENRTTEPAHAVSGEKRPGEESDTEAPGWLAERWGESDPVGQQPGP